MFSAKTTGESLGQFFYWIIAACIALLLLVGVLSYKACNNPTPSCHVIEVEQPVQPITVITGRDTTFRYIFN